METRRITSIVRFAVAAFWLWAGVLTPPVAESAVLRVRSLGEIQSLDWNRASTWVDGFVIRNMMEGLVGVDRHSKPVPALAERWTVSADNKQFIFTIRADARWSDGVPVLAQHFVDSWERLLNPQTRAKYAFILFDIVGAKAYAEGKIKNFSEVGVRAIDARRLEVRLQAPCAFWAWIPSFYATFPIRKDSPQFNSGGGGPTVGPYVLAGDRPDQTAANPKFTLGRSLKPSLRLTKNRHYYGSMGNIDQIDFVDVRNDRDGATRYERGELDFVPKLSAIDVVRFQKRPDLHRWPEWRTVHLRLNTKSGPTAHPWVRRAIAAAIDRSQLREAFDGRYSVTTTFAPLGLLGGKHSFGKAVHASDVLNAKKLLRAGLEQLHLNPAAIPPLNLLTVAFEDQIILAQFIQNELQTKLGLPVRIHVFEPKRYYSPNLNHFDFAMQINFWGADYPDPDNYFSIFMSDSRMNRYGWTNLAYDKIVRAARRASKLNERREMYLDAERLLTVEEVATVPLYFVEMYGLVRPNIRHFEPGPMTWGLFKNLDINK